MNASKPNPAISSFATVTKYLGRYRWYLVVGVVAVMGANGLMLATPYLTKLIFDKLGASAPMEEVGLLVLAMIGLTVGSGICRFTIRRTIIWMSRWPLFRRSSATTKPLIFSRKTIGTRAKLRPR